MLGFIPQISIECTGVQSTIQTAIYATCSGEVVVPVEFGAEMTTVPLVNAALREVDIRGVFHYCKPQKVNVKPLVTHCFTLEQVFEMSRQGLGVKVIFKFDKNNQNP